MIIKPFSAWSPELAADFIEEFEGRKLEAYNEILDLDSLPNEHWKAIPGYNGNYQVSDLGRVKSVGRYVERSIAQQKVWRNEKILKQSFQNNYLAVGLSFNGVHKSHHVHRLVAETFIPNHGNKPQIDHINGIKTDNRIENLRWATAKENCNNPLRLEKFCGENNHFYGKHHSEASIQRIKESLKDRDFSGAKNPASKKIRNIETNEVFLTVKEAGASVGVSDNSIRNSIKRHHKSAGYHWEYVND